MAKDSPKPTITKAELIKMMSCQDKIKAGLDGLAKATYKLNQAREDLVKQSDGSATRSSYNKKIKQSQAAKNAAAKVDKITKKYNELIDQIKQHIGILESQILYKNNMQDLIQYYKKNITNDKSKIQEIESKRAISNRMTTYYHTKDEDAIWYRKYLKYGYWIAIIAVICMVLYVLWSGNYIHQAFFAMKASYELIRDNIKSDKEPDKEPNKEPDKEPDKEPKTGSKSALIVGGAKTSKSDDDGGFNLTDNNSGFASTGNNEEYSDSEEDSGGEEKSDSEEYSDSEEDSSGEDSSGEEYSDSGEDSSGEEYSDSEEDSSEEDSSTKKDSGEGIHRRISKFAKKHNGILIPMSLLAVLLVAPAITKPTVRSLKPIFFPYA